MACTAGAFAALPGCSSGSGKSSSASNTVTLEAYDNYFKPAELTAQAGKRITIEFKNEGVAEHNFSITDLDVSKDVEAHKKATVTFTPGSSGALPFFCKYHEALGMKGTLTVTG